LQCALGEHQVTEEAPQVSALARLSSLLYEHINTLGGLDGSWPRSRLRVLQPRWWRLGFDEVLQLNALMRDGELFAAESSYQSAFNSIYGKLNQKALGLNTHFNC